MTHARRGQIFQEVEKNHPRSNEFNLSHDRKFSTSFGSLTPIMVMDCVPGDKVRIKPSAMVRLAPLIAPVMHRMNVFMHYFFVPNRLIFKAWEPFITGGEDGEDNTVYPYANYDPQNFLSGSLPDYMGLPIDTDVIAGANLNTRISSMPFAAYQKIFNEYYRDQNLVDKVLDSVGAGAMLPADFTEISTLRNRAWQHDYFTSSLPWTQKGPEAMLPLGDTAPLDYITNDAAVASDISGNPLTGSANVSTNIAGNRLQDTSSNISLDISDSHVADLSQATASSINDLRRAMKLQVWLERNARGGSRYIESISMHFGVESSDKRLQRPEYIGGLKTPIKVSEVLQTSETLSTPQGTMAGHAISVGGGDNFQYNVEEHGYIIGIMSVMPVTAYQQGIPRHFQRIDKFDYYWPEFAHIGEQPVMNAEIAHTGDANYNSGIFGYVPRYSEYKFISNTVHGDFKNTLDFWHLARKFGSPPNLNEDFITMDDNEIKRIFAVGSNDQKLWCQVINEVHARRLMPIFGTPKIN